jgi:hypothetical protein
MEKIRINGSICLSELNELAKAGHSAFTRSQDGRIYCNFTGWCNSANDDFKDFSANVNGKQDAKDKDATIINGRKSKGYIASGKIKPNSGEQSGTAVGTIIKDEIPDDSELTF